MELEAALLHPRFQAAALPSAVRKLVQVGHAEPARIKPSAPAPATNAPPPATVAAPDAKIDNALKAYLDFIRIENSPHHVAGKLSMMRRFFGTKRIDALAGLPNPRRNGQGPGEIHFPFFRGDSIRELTASLVQSFMAQLDVSKKTKRHYREFFHHFFEFCMKFEFYRPTNWHNPNPISALPSYVSRNRRIVFLTTD